MSDLAKKINELKTTQANFVSPDPNRREILENLGQIIEELKDEELKPELTALQAKFKADPNMYGADGVALELAINALITKLKSKYQQDKGPTSDLPAPAPEPASPANYDGKVSAMLTVYSLQTATR